MPWLRSQRLLSRLLGLGTTVWLCRKVGCWARSFGRLGALVLRFVHRGTPVRRVPDYGNLLLDSLYPGSLPSPDSVRRSKQLVEESKAQEEGDERGAQEALCMLSEAILLSPPEPCLYLARAQFHERRHRYVEALDDAELCVSLDAGCAAAWLAKGKAERGVGRAADAALSFEAGLRAEPRHAELIAELAALQAEPPPNLLRQLRDLVFAARLGLENLFRWVEDPEKTNDAFVEANSELLDAQFSLLSHTLRVNTTVLYDSPMLCDAYEQSVFACSQLVAGAPAAFSTVLTNAPGVVEGLALALRVGWQVSHSVPKMAANALVALATCPDAEPELRKQAAWHLLGGMLRWLLDARPELESEGEEVAGCSCTVPWKAAACFLERLFEEGRAQPWVREACETWPDIGQLCQWLTLSVRDYHASPLGLVFLLSLPGVAAVVMRSEAVVNFFIPAPPGEDDEGSEADDEDLDGGGPAPVHGFGGAGAASGIHAAAASSASAATSSAAVGAVPEDAPAIWSFWRWGQYVPSLPELVHGPGGDATDADEGASMASPGASFATHGASFLTHGPTLLSVSTAAVAASTAAGGPAVSSPAHIVLLQEPPAPPPQRLGEWLMASVGYLFLFIEGDVLFPVCACRALQAMALSDPHGVDRLLQSMWLGVPFLGKLSHMACSQTAALDLLHVILQGPCPDVRVAARSLARNLAGAPLSTLQVPATPGLPPTSPRSGGGSGAAAATAAAAGEELHLEGDAAPAVAAGSLLAAAAALGRAAAAEASAAGAEQEAAVRRPAALADGAEAAAAAASELHREREASREEVLAWMATAAAAVADAAESNPTEPQTPVAAEEEAVFAAEEEAVPSWAEFYQELLNELAFPSETGDKGRELVTLVNFASKARLLTETTSFRVVPPGGGTAASDELPPLECAAEPAGWNCYMAAQTKPDGFGMSPTSSSPVSASAAAPAIFGGGPPVRLPLFFDSDPDVDIGSEAYVRDPRKVGRAVLISRRSIRQSMHVQNWAQATAAAQRAGAAAVVVFNDLDTLEPFRVGLFGEVPPTIPAFMVHGVDGAALSVAAAVGSELLLGGRPTATSAAGRSSTLDAGRFGAAQEPPTLGVAGSSGRPAAEPSALRFGELPPWPLTGARPPPDVAQAWSLLEAMSSHEAVAQAELQALLHRMSVPEKRVWLTRRLVRHHRSQQQDADGGLVELPLAFVEGDRSLTPLGQMEAIRQQLVEKIGLGAEDLCGEFEVRFKSEGGVGSAVLREWIDLLAGEAFLHPVNRLLVSYDRRQTFFPDPAAPFCNPQWRLDYEALGRLLGLALWHSCTLDLPIHPRVCTMLFGFPPTESSPEEQVAALKEVDADLHRTKVRWLLAMPVAELGVEMPFTDPLGQAEEGSGADASEAAAATTEHSEAVLTSSSSSSASAPPAPPAAAASLEQLPEVLRLEDRLPGHERSFPGQRLLQVGAAEVALDGGGGERLVSDENKQEFVNALAAWRTHGAIEMQVEAIARGLRRVVPEAVTSELRGLLRPEEICQLLSGSGEINVDDWERHTAYTHGLHKDSELVTCFWRTVRDWNRTPEERVRLPRLLQFVTGSARVPVGGFAELVGFNGAKHPFTLSKGVHLTPQSLPMAHACICTLDVPPYADFETCRSKMTQMLELGRSPFDEAAALQAGRGGGDEDGDRD